MAQEIAGELGGQAFSAEELSSSPVPPTGPQEWRLPDEVGDTRLQKSTQTGPSWVRETPGAARVLRALGLSPRDLTVYAAFPTQDAAGLVAYHAWYPDPQQALKAFKGIFEAPDTRWEPLRLGEISVERGVSAEHGPIGTIYLWADHRCIYQVVGPDQAIAETLANSIIPFEQSDRPNS